MITNLDLEYKHTYDYIDVHFIFRSTLDGFSA